MKARIISHENHRSVVMDRDGVFHFTRGHTSKPIGTEIDIRAWDASGFMKIAAIVLCFVLVISLGAFAWMLGSTNIGSETDIANGQLPLSDTPPGIAGSGGDILDAGDGPAGIPQCGCRECIDGCECTCTCCEPESVVSD